MNLQLVLSAVALVVGLLLVIKAQSLANNAASRHPGGLDAFGGRWDPPFVKFARAHNAYEKATGDLSRKWKVYGLGYVGMVLFLLGAFVLISVLPDAR